MNSNGTQVESRAPDLGEALEDAFSMACWAWDRGKAVELVQLLPLASAAPGGVWRELARDLLQIDLKDHDQGEAATALGVLGRTGSAEMLAKLEPLAWSGSTFREALSKVRLALAAHDVIDLARDLERGRFVREADLRQAVENLQAGFAAPAGAAGLKVQYFGDPEKEPDLEPAPAWVEGLLHSGFVVVTGAWKRASKTRLALGLTFAIHNGIPFLGRRVTQAPCAWVQRDMPVENFLLYSRKLREGMGFPVAAIPFVADPIDLRRPEDQAALEAVLKDTGTKVVFLDSSRGVCGGVEEKSEDIRPFVRGYICDRLRDGLGISVVLLAHPPKNAERISVRGSGDFEAAADSILRLAPQMVERDKDDDQEERVAFVQLSGEGRHPPVSLAFAFDDLSKHGGGWVIKEVDEEEKLRRRGTGTPEGRLLAFLEGEGAGQPWAAADLAARARVRRRDMPALLARLEGRGLIGVVKTGPKGGKLWGPTLCSGPGTYREQDGQNQWFPGPPLKGGAGTIEEERFPAGNLSEQEAGREPGEDEG